MNFYKINNFSSEYNNIASPHAFLNQDRVRQAYSTTQVTIFKDLMNCDYLKTRLDI